MTGIIQSWTQLLDRDGKTVVGTELPEHSLFVTLSTLTTPGGVLIPEINVVHPDALLRAGGTMLGPILLPDGTAASPTLGFSQQANMGIYRDQVNELRIALGSTDPLTEIFFRGGGTYRPKIVLGEDYQSDDVAFYARSPTPTLRLNTARGAGGLTVRFFQALATNTVDESQTALSEFGATGTIASPPTYGYTYIGNAYNDARFKTNNNGTRVDNAVSGAGPSAVPFTVVQDKTVHGTEAQRIQQDDISEGFIDFQGSARGSANLADSDVVDSVRVELNGTKYRLALYPDA